MDHTPLVDAVSAMTMFVAGIGSLFGVQRWRNGHAPPAAVGSIQFQEFVSTYQGNWNSLTTQLSVFDRRLQHLERGISGFDDRLAGLEKRTEHAQTTEMNVAAILAALKRQKAEREAADLLG
jgi:hypothetical protein